MTDFLRNLGHADNDIYAWGIVITLYFGAFEFILWHAYVWRVMSWPERQSRGGMLLLMLNNATATMFAINGWDSIWRRFVNLLAGVLIMVGMAQLLWQYRFNRQTAALQPHLGDPSLSPPLSDTLGNDSSNQGDPDGFQKR